MKTSDIEKLIANKPLDKQITILESLLNRCKDDTDQILFLGKLISEKQQTKEEPPSVRISPIIEPSPKEQATLKSHFLPENAICQKYIQKLELLLIEEKIPEAREIANIITNQFHSSLIDAEMFNLRKLLKELHEKEQTNALPALSSPYSINITAELNRLSFLITKNSLAEAKVLANEIEKIHYRLLNKEAADLFSSLLKRLYENEQLSIQTTKLNRLSFLITKNSLEEAKVLANEIGNIHYQLLSKEEADRFDTLLEKLYESEQLNTQLENFKKDYAELKKQCESYTKAFEEFNASVQREVKKSIREYERLIAFVLAYYYLKNPSLVPSYERISLFLKEAQKESPAPDSYNSDLPENVTEIILKNLKECLEPYKKLLAAGR